MLQGDGSLPKPTANTNTPRNVPQGRNKSDFQETVPGPNPWTLHAGNHQCPFYSLSVPKELICLSASHGRGATGGSPPSGLCSSLTIPGRCYRAMCGGTPGAKIKLRTARIGPFPKLPLLCPTTSPPQPVSTPNRSQPLTKTAVGPGRGCSSCRARMGTTGLCHTWGPGLGVGDPRSPALPSYRDKDQPVPRCQNDAVLEGAWPRLSSGTAVASRSQESQPQ